MCALLTDRGHAFDLALVGGGALMLTGLMQERSTHDLDVVALVDGSELRTANPLPEPLLDAVRDVANWASPTTGSTLARHRCLT